MKQLTPDYIFETSWEVCNKVGGIYAVLSTRAASMQKEHPDKIIFFGPDFGKHSDNYFKEDKQALQQWRKQYQANKGKESLPSIRVGRWNVPGEPIAILLKFDHLWAEKDNIYGWAWQNFGVQSHAAYGDYDESCLFGYAAGQVMESLYRYIIKTEHYSKVVAHSNEWQTAFDIFYIRHYCPEIGTLFTTHATGIGRSIAGNGKPLYDYFTGYNGDQMAQELNMVSKHSVEKEAAHHCDCFTTVSKITARECKQLLDKEPDIVTPNGFEPRFVPKGKALNKARAEARKALTATAENILGGKVPENSVYVCISGRQEWKNKGIDVFIESMYALGNMIYDRKKSFTGDIIAFVLVPYLDRPVTSVGKASVLYVPYYLDGRAELEGCFSPLNGKTYYDLLCGMDMSIFPSYYEPWGYTPHESVAFHVPTITTSLAGFGSWVGKSRAGVKVIERTDSNTHEVISEIADTIYNYICMPASAREAAREDAAAVAHKAEWRTFFKYYRSAYNIALQKALARNGEPILGL